MENISEIRAELDKMYQLYKNNKNSLNAGQTKETAKLIFSLVSAEENSAKAVAAELARFSGDITNAFFDTLTQGKSVSMAKTDEILKELAEINKKAHNPQFIAQKYVFAVNMIMNRYHKAALESKQLPVLVVFIAEQASKSEKIRNKLYKLINGTSGGIFRLDYSAFAKEELSSIWTDVDKIYADLSKAQYVSAIMEWAKKYGFADDEAANGAEQKESANFTEKTDADVSQKSKTGDEAVSDATPDEKKSAEVTVPLEALVKDAFYDLRREICKGQENVISALARTIEPIQGEISRSREIGSENHLLKVKLADAERQLSELRSKLQETNQALLSARSENEELKSQAAELESKNDELDSKLNDAYSINSREASLEADRIRSELQKAFGFLYEDWLEYESSEVSEENYESLQAIIKKVFRSLERNGINFKGND